MKVGGQTEKGGGGVIVVSCLVRKNVVVRLQLDKYHLGPPQL